MKNDDPFAPWNSPMTRDDPFAPHNDPMNSDDLSKPWNSIFGSRSDLTQSEKEYYERFGE